MSILNAIKQNGFAELKTSISDDVVKAMDGFERFLNYDFAERKKWTFDTARMVNSQIGYVPREGGINPMTRQPYDFKDVFHFDRSLLARAKERGLNVAEWKDWFEALENLYKKGEDICSKAAEELDTLHPGLKIMERIKHIEGNDILRLLHYHMKKGETGVLGRGHTDEWLFTVNFGENIPGLRVGEQGNMQFIARDKNTAILYPGKKAESLTNGDLKALYHEVVDPQLKEDFKDRFAVTFFFDANVPAGRMM